MADRRNVDGVEGEDVWVVDDADAHRYEVFVDDELAGYLVYQAQPGLITFLHTEVDPAFEGHGIGSRLVAAALEDVRSRGLELKPVCPFVRRYLARHPEYSDLVPAR